MPFELYTLVKWAFIIFILAFLIQVLRKLIPALIRKLKEKALVQRPPFSPTQAALKYGHAHDLFYIKERRLEDKWLEKYGVKKEEQLEKQFERKFQKKYKQKQQKQKKKR